MPNTLQKILETVDIHLPSLAMVIFGLIIFSNTTEFIPPRRYFRKRVFPNPFLTHEVNYNWNCFFVCTMRHFDRFEFDKGICFIFPKTDI